MAQLREDKLKTEVTLLVPKFRRVVRVEVFWYLWYAEKESKNLVQSLAHLPRFGCIVLMVLLNQGSILH